MTVKELIQELEKVHNKDLDVVMLEGSENTTDTFDVFEGVKCYYGKKENGAYVHASRTCVFIG